MVLLCLSVLSIALSGCTNKIVTKTEYLFPPQAYLTACEKTEFNGSTYGDAIDYLVTVIGERNLCASKIDSIRDWMSKAKAGFE